MSWRSNNHEITAEATNAWNELKALLAYEQSSLECDLTWHYHDNVQVGECDCPETDRDRLDDR